jgi:hypothetical protein
MEEIKQEYIRCPFCCEDGFDLPGLKSHLINDCDIFPQVENISRIFQTNSATNLNDKHINM